MTDDPVLSILREMDTEKCRSRTRGAARKAFRRSRQGPHMPHRRGPNFEIRRCFHQWMGRRRLPRCARLRSLEKPGRNLSTAQYVGRARRPDVGASLPPGGPPLLGFWTIVPLEREASEEEVCSIELVLSNGTKCSTESPFASCTAKELKERFTHFLKALEPSDRLLPSDPAYIEQVFRPAAVEGKPEMPRHNVEVVVVAENGGIFIDGWIDDTVEELDRVRVATGGWQVAFNRAALARTARDDVQAALGYGRRHAFGFWGFAAHQAIGRGFTHCSVELSTKNGACQRIEVPLRVVDAAELRNLALVFLGSARYLGNPQLDSIASIGKSVAQQIVDLNLRITRGIVSAPYVERFGDHLSPRKGTIVVCLYGKPEYLFLQNALFAGLPGIEDYEFIYVCNSPELSERLLREARISSIAYGLNLTLVLLPANAGFGAANNTAVKFARTDRVLIVNPDVFPLDLDWARRHCDIVEQLPPAQTHLFGAPLYYDDGSLMHGGMYFDADVGVSLDGSAFRRETFLRVEHYGKGAPPATNAFLRSRPVPAITGAFMSFDRGWFEKLGGFAEDYVFGHYEDADLCLRSIAQRHRAVDPRPQALAPRRQGLDPPASPRRRHDRQPMAVQQALGRRGCSRPARTAAGTPAVSREGRARPGAG